MDKYNSRDARKKIVGAELLFLQTLAFGVLFCAIVKLNCNK